METATKKLAELAFNFLCKRNPLNIEQSGYVAILMDFKDKKGDDAICGLAGAYLYVTQEIKGEEKQHNMIVEFLNHDLGERNDEFSLPRSDSYQDYWKQKCEEYGWIKAETINQDENHN